jgi:sugar phosphate isomerase/epimerase
VVNIRAEPERPRAERLVADVGRLRKDAGLFRELLGPRGTRIPVTAVVANLADPKDRGTRKALARVRRAARTTPQADRRRASGAASPFGGR